ncbi:type I restriction-modification system specificity subunit [Microlunatus phosphovorus NM-1]|uniref:Type I restriction-modification system specificity subunit n=1 Tax=Microlunatus phosphovorus (strain ATCC 700054 / DSM 10555 / JCM 9379 / NBRC 101784 / NCIMB 13414 / VKM Ac-1990 / NM-1) TaxID=1032480 RepID=F5XE54_MICPN|nr:restriction endonuclease subunit S [Microlunatus phosphovorus]BAK37602.1 type I restriction-modification system specificity subunit [Microlunatus phosphovorus NM-1]
MTSTWTTTTIGALAHVSRGASPRPIASPRWFDSSGDVRWVRIADVNRSNGRTLLATTQALSADGVARSRYLKPGTLIMSIAATVGIPVITGVPACIHDGFVSLENLKANKRFMLYLLKASEPRLREAGQSGSQMNVNSDIVRGLTVRIPSSVEEQARVASVLWDLDDLIVSLENAIVKKRAIKQGVMQELLTGRTRLRGFTDEWSTRSLSTFGTFLRGGGIKRDEVRQAGVPCIRYGEIYTTFEDYTISTVSFVSGSVAAMALPLRSGDILFAGSGETKAEIGMNVAYIGDTPAVAGGDIIVLRGTEYDPVYLATLLNTPELANQKARGGQGDAVVHINWRVLAGLEVTVPELPEQHAIAQVLIDADDEIAALQRRLDATRAIKQGMMHELLSGRTRLAVKEDAA